MSQVKQEIPKLKNYNDEVFQQRLSKRYEELYSLYSSIYHNDEMFNNLIDMLFDYYKNRPEKLKKLDNDRLKETNWCCKNDSIVIQLYTEKFAGTLLGLEKKLDYLQRLGIKFVYALPFLKSPPGKSDGGFACSDYRNVREDLGTIEDLEHLISSLHDHGMGFIMDYAITNTSDEHEWARRAKKGEKEYQDRYHFYDSWYVPNKFDAYGVMGHYFGGIVPENFTFVPECQKIVMTTFYPYQWDLNFRNPIVLNESISNVLYLFNLGVDVIMFDGCSSLWKIAGTNCRDLLPDYMLTQIINLVIEVVCPGTAASFNLKRHEKKNSEVNDSKSEVNNLSNEVNDSKSKVNDSKSEVTKNDSNFQLTESGVLANISNEDNLMTLMCLAKAASLDDDEEEERYEIEYDFDVTKEIGKIHCHLGWLPHLWASLALGDVKAITYSINLISNRFAGDNYMTNVHNHDDIKWSYGFDVSGNELIGNGINSNDDFRGGIISMYRYLNDYYTGNMPGSLSKGIIFAEDLVTGKAFVCGTTASLLGLETSLNEEKRASKSHENHNEKKQKQKSCIAKRNTQTAIDRIVFMHAVAASMPSIFTIYCGDEIGQLNDYSYQRHDDISYDTRYLHRGRFHWENTKLIDDDKDSCQSKIFNGIRAITSARIACPFFTENVKTVFSKNCSFSEYNKKSDITNDKSKLEVDGTILTFKRIRSEGKFILFVFNFCEYKRHVRIPEDFASGNFKDMITNQPFDQVNDFIIEGYGYLWLLPIE